MITWSWSHDCLHVFINHTGWSHDLVTEAWKKNKSDACTKAGLDLAHVHSKDVIKLLISGY